jgi:hypothetical protein
MHPIPDRTGQTGGVNISGTVGYIAGDLVARDKNVFISDSSRLEDRNDSLEKTVRKKGSIEF